MHKCAILQPNYIPWKGVFDMINQVDTFVFLDDVQFTRQDWRTRNKIKTANGGLWLSVPVKKSCLNTIINQIEISQDQKNFNWQEKHYKTIVGSYKKAPYFAEYHYLLEEIYLLRKWTNLSEFNIFTTKLLADTLGIQTHFINSSDFTTLGIKDDKIIEVCQNVGADFYLSGPAAKDYIINKKFEDSGIQLAYIDYNNYPKYPQLHGEFDHYVSVLDVLFNCGKNARDYILNA